MLLAAQVTAYLRGGARGARPQGARPFRAVKGRQPGGRGRDRAIAHLRRCGRPTVWAPGPVPTGATGVMASFTHGTGSQHPHRGDRGPRWSAAAAWTPMCVPMTRVERARGDRVVAAAHWILVIAHALSRRAGPTTTSVATTAPTEQTPRGSRAALSLTVTVRPPCDLEGPRRSVTGVDVRSVRIEMAQRRIRYNRG